MYTAADFIHPRFLLSPLSTLIASLDELNQAITLKEVLIAYELLYVRLRMLVGWVEEQGREQGPESSGDGSAILQVGDTAMNIDIDEILGLDMVVDEGKEEVSSFPSLRTFQKHTSSLALVLSRDICAVTIDSSPPQSFSPTSMHSFRSHGYRPYDLSLEVDQYTPNPSSFAQATDAFSIGSELEKLELLAAICINALKVLGLLAFSERLISLCSEETLQTLLTSLLTILNAPFLYVPRKRKIALLTVWTLARNRFPQSVFEGSLSQSVRCLKILCEEGEGLKSGGGSSLNSHLRVDAFTAVTNFIKSHPDSFLLPLVAEILPIALDISLSAHTSNSKALRKEVLKTIQATAVALLDLSSFERRKEETHVDIHSIASQITQEFLLGQMELAKVSKSTSLQGYINASLTAAGIPVKTTTSSSHQPDTSHFSSPGSPPPKTPDVTTLLTFLSSLIILLGPSLFRSHNSHHTLKKISNFFLENYWSYFGHPRSTIRRYAEWGWRCMIWTAIAPHPNLGASTQDRWGIGGIGDLGGMAMETIPDVLLNKLDCRIGIGLIHTMRVSGRYKVWETLRVLNTMLFNDILSVRRDGADVLLAFLQPVRSSLCDSSSPLHSVGLDWKKLIPPLLFSLPLSPSLAKDSMTTVHIEAQSTLLTSSQISPLSDQELKSHWDDLVGLFWISLRSFEMSDDERQKEYMGKLSKAWDRILHSIPLRGGEKRLRALRPCLLTLLWRSLKKSPPPPIPPSTPISIPVLPNKAKGKISAKDGLQPASRPEPSASPPNAHGHEPPISAKSPISAKPSTSDLPLPARLRFIESLLRSYLTHSSSRDPSHGQTSEHTSWAVHHALHALSHHFPTSVRDIKEKGKYVEQISASEMRAWVLLFVNCRVICWRGCHPTLLCMRR